MYLYTHTHITYIYTRRTLSAWMYVVPSIDSAAQGKDIDFLETFLLFQDNLPDAEQVQELEERAGGKSPSMTPTEMEESQANTTKPEEVEAKDPSSEPTRAIPAEDASSNQRGAHAKDGSPAFKQTMSVEKIMDTIGQFTRSKNLAQVTTLVVGTNSSHQRKGAMTEVALTKREQRRQRLQESTENNIQQPPNWDSGTNLPADVQCPPKKKGRKPKGNAETSKTTSRKRQIEKEDTSETAAPKRRRKRNQTQETKEPKSEEIAPKKRAKAKTRTLKRPAAAPKAKRTPASKEAENTPSSGSGLSAQEKVEREREQARAEKKKAVSRKSAAYHRAFKNAKNNGLDPDQCKAAAKKVLSL